MAKKQRLRVTGLVRSKNKILLLHMKPQPYDFWEFPSGHVEFGESPEEAINREMKEETGLKCVNKGLFAVNCCSYRKDNDDVHEIIVAYLFETEGGKVTLDRKEHDDYKWMTLAEMKKVPNLVLTVTSIMNEIEELLR